MSVKRNVTVPDGRSRRTRVIMRDRGDRVTSSSGIDG
jgi:hypothetical protein